MMSKYSENMPPSLKGAVEWMLDEIKPGSTFLDFGCSTGYFGKFLKDAKKCAVYGVEISEDAKQAKQVLDGVYTFDLDGEWPESISERKYDYAFYGDVLEHLKDPGRALMNTTKLLGKDGLIFVSIPNIAHMSIRLELMMGNFEYESMGILDNTHLKYFTLKSFSELASRSGLEVMKVDYTLNEYPKEVIKDLLAKSGLEATSRFWEIVNTPEAKAFQYKFTLRPTALGKPTKNKTNKLAVKPEQYKEEFISDLRNQIKDLDNHAKEQAKIIEHLKHKAETLENRGLANRLKKIVRKDK